MQQQGDRPVRGGRPSLLAPGEQAVPERQGILSSLDSVKAPAAPARAAAPRARRWAWGGAAVGAVVVGGALFLLAEGDSEDPRAQTVAVADAPHVPAPVHTPAPVPAAPAAAPASVSVPASVPASAPPAASASVPAPASVPAAASAPAAPPAHAAVPAGPIPNPLAELAPPPSKAERRKAAAHEREEARRVADKHAADKRAADKRAADKRAEEKRAKDKHAADKRDAQKHKGRMQDSDVVLLTALMSHIDPKSRKATPAELLETCKRYNTAGEEQCRIRVCNAAGRKEPACKHVPAAPAS